MSDDAGLSTPDQIDAATAPDDATQTRTRSFRPILLSILIVAGLLLWCAYDVLPIFAVRHRLELLSRLAAPGTQWGTVKPTLPLHGFKVINMGAMVSTNMKGDELHFIILASRRSHLVSGIQEILRNYWGNDASVSFTARFLPPGMSEVEVDTSGTVVSVH